MAQTPPGSVGKPVLGTSVRLVDENGQDVASGEPGEIVARGPQIFKGYYNRPRETETAFKDGWYHTGDVGRMDENGYLFLVDRLKHIIKTSGYTVFPAEVERALYTHPAVAETAVVGVPRQGVGEVVTAFVVLKPGQDVSSADLSNHCKAELTAYKCPRKIEIRGSLPKNSGGKIDRQALLT